MKLISTRTVLGMCLIIGLYGLTSCGGGHNHDHDQQEGQEQKHNAQILPVKLCQKFTKI